ncbi:hypothetical protein ACE14D_05530, partial [Streptomyces sp. Act-28]
MSSSQPFAAVDLGASSGRVMLARVGAGTLELHEVHRFPNRPVRVGGTLYWDVLGLYRGVLDGLRAAGAAAGGRLAGVGLEASSLVWMAVLRLSIMMISAGYFSP